MQELLICTAKNCHVSENWPEFSIFMDVSFSIKFPILQRKTADFNQMPRRVAHNYVLQYYNHLTVNYIFDFELLYFSAMVNFRI